MKKNPILFGVLFFNLVCLTFSLSAAGKVEKELPSINDYFEAIRQGDRTAFKFAPYFKGQTIAGVSPLQIAVYIKHPRVVSALLQQGEDPNPVMPAGPLSLLHYAAFFPPPKL